jgi:demethylmenaquinone methyltransferase/2-methoxy-6-polyprenyl-1,4-benzoquinol methylase
VDGDGVLAEQLRYYRARAPEYDDAYSRTGTYDRGEAVNAEWQAELSLLMARFRGVELGDDVLEVATGTGFWTAQLADRAEHVTAIDASPEMLARTRARLGGRARAVDFVVADLFTWWPQRTWDGCVGFFWLCHVPDDRLPAFLAAVAAALRPGGAVFFGDKSQFVEPRPAVGPRTLRDGRTFSVVDRIRRPSELRDAFGVAGIAVDVVTLGARFCAITGTRG